MKGTRAGSFHEPVSGTKHVESDEHWATESDVNNANDSKKSIIKLRNSKSRVSVKTHEVRDQSERCHVFFFFFLFFLYKRLSALICAPDETPVCS